MQFVSWDLMGVGGEINLTSSYEYHMVLSFNPQAFLLALRVWANPQVHISSLQSPCPCLPMFCCAIRS